MAIAFFLLCILPYAFPQSGQVCQDKHRHCAPWKRSRYCDPSSQHYSFMKDNCAKTCKFCQVSVDGKWSDWKAGPCTKTCGDGEKTMTRSCTNPKPKHGGKKCTGAETKKIRCNEKSCPGQVCQDKPSQQSNCAYWKGLQYCDPSHQYYNFMKDNCPKTCKFCQVSACNDNPQYKQNCPGWASSNYCKQGSYVVWMQQNCKRSCGLCGGGSVTTVGPPVVTTKVTPGNLELPCAFETDLCQWVNEPLDDAADWSVGKASSGPSAGAGGSSNYAYVDSSSSGSKASLFLPLELALPSGTTNKGSMCLKFQYVLSGGSLRVIDHPYPTANNKNPSQRTVSTLSSASSWTEAKVQVTVDNGRQLIIEGSGAAYIDQLGFVSGQC